MSPYPTRRSVLLGVVVGGLRSIRNDAGEQASSDATLIALGCEFDRIMASMDRLLATVGETTSDARRLNQLLEKLEPRMVKKLKRLKKWPSA